MSAVKTFEDYLTNQVPQVDAPTFLVNLALTAIFAGILSWAYSKFAKSQSNRSAFAANFILIAMTTMLVISVVKSSLALSLGLVGALSIVRFRTAIKDPEELAFLFISISLGLGFGADQRKVTMIGFGLIIICYVILRLKYFKWTNSSVMHMILSTDKKVNLPLNDISDVVKKFSSRATLKRISANDDSTELSMLVEFPNIEQVQELKKSLGEKYPQFNFNLIEYQGIVE